MRKQTNEKIKNVLEDNRISEVQRSLIEQWHKHVQTFTDETKILERLYVIREFALFFGKPFETAARQDLEDYLIYKRDENRQTLTNNRVLSVSQSSINSYKLRVQEFYKYLYKHTDYKIDKELAYPTPKIIENIEIPREERHKKRIEALLNNTIISLKREDKGLSSDELRLKYADKLLRSNHLEVLRKFYNYKVTSGIVSSNMGFTTKLFFLKRLGLFLNDKTYKEATREDIQEFLAKIQTKLGKIDNSYKAFLLDFYRFVYDMFGNEQPRQYPSVVSWLYTKRKKIDDKIAKSIITDQEIKWMIDACDNARDKAIIAVLRDCSARVGELTNCRIKDLKITEKGMADSKYKHQIATIKLKGKTGERINLLHWSVSYLRQWLSTHPLRNKPNFEDMHLFVARKECRYGQPLTAVGVNKMLQKMAKYAKITRHIHAHLFRHTNLTNMAKILSETELKIHAGWGTESKMASVYVHLTHQDVHNKMLKSMGFDLDEKEAKEENLLKSLICPNHICGFENPSDAKFCLKCGYPLSLETALKVTRVREQEDELHKELFSKDLSKISSQGSVQETMYQLLKTDPKLMEKLKKIIELTQGA